MKFKFWGIVAGMTLFSVFMACNHETDAPSAPKPTPYQIEIPKFFPTLLNITPDNPMTEEGIALGRYLFYDGRLSGRTEPDSMMTCGTCHVQSSAFECGINNPSFPGGHPHGITGIFTPHYMTPMINLVWNSNGYFWNGMICPQNPSPIKRTLEDVVYLGLIAPHELHGDSNKTTALIQSIPGYPELFEKAFGTKTVTFKNIERAVAQFIRTINSSNTKFDKYMRGETQLSPAELRGYVVFTTENAGDCFHCHGASGNPLFTSNLFYNNGKDTIFTGIYEDARDRYHFTGDPKDIGAYKAPTLRNVALTAPYMHDGRFTTLDQVIEFYSTGVVWSPSISPLMHHVVTGGAQLTQMQKSDLKAFLYSLTDSVLIKSPSLSRPATMPDGSK
ncbi:MAG: cytochrome c peroxidase [Bacteroidota bacterium]